VSTTDTIQKIKRELEPLRDSLLNHPVYHAIDNLSQLHSFMQYHVFAVWDFMSLLKALQQSLGVWEVPWLPPGDPPAVRFVNEIVLGEESDEDGRGEYASHFEIYRRAMRQCNASTTQIDWFIECLKAKQPVGSALELVGAEVPVKQFVLQTFSTINSGEAVAVAAAFLFGREDLLPDIFQRVVRRLNIDEGGRLTVFQYYLERHIEIDGDQHGPLAEKLLASMCGQDKQRWEMARVAAYKALEARKSLWDGIVVAIRQPADGKATGVRMD
jgi:hypothetical protein